MKVNRLTPNIPLNCFPFSLRFRGLSLSRIRPTSHLSPSIHSRIRLMGASKASWIDSQIISKQIEAKTLARKVRWSLQLRESAWVQVKTLHTTSWSTTTHQEWMPLKIQTKIWSENLTLSPKNCFQLAKTTRVFSWNQNQRLTQETSIEKCSWRNLAPLYLKKTLEIFKMLPLSKNRLIKKVALG